eukprot:12089128-Ditylum_brightwellii.AAC.1
MPDEVPAGDTPVSIVMFAYNDFVDAVQLGDGMRMTASSSNAARESSEKEGSKVQYEDPHAITGKFSEVRIAQLEDLLRSPDIYEKLTTTLAPSIWELDDVKKG